MFDLTIDGAKALKDYESGLASFKGKNLQRGILMAMNQSIGRTKTLASKLIRTEMGTKAAQVKKRIMIRRTRTRGGIMGKDVSLTAFGGPIRLIHFSAKEKTGTKKGVQYKKGVSARPYGKRQVFPDAFIAPVKYGGIREPEKSTLGVWARKGWTSHPIKQYYGPAVSSTAKEHDAEIRAFYDMEMTARVPKAVAKAVAMSLPKILRKGVSLK